MLPWSVIIHLPSLVHYLLAVKMYLLSNHVYSDHQNVCGKIGESCFPSLVGSCWLFPTWIMFTFLATTWSNHVYPPRAKIATSLFANECRRPILLLALNSFAILQKYNDKMSAVVWFLLTALHLLSCTLSSQLMALYVYNRGIIQLIYGTAW